MDVASNAGVPQFVHSKKVPRKRLKLQGANQSQHSTDLRRRWRRFRLLLCRPRPRRVGGHHHGEPSHAPKEIVPRNLHGYSIDLWALGTRDS